MRALVTGATGFIGRHLVNRLIADGVEVRRLRRAASGEHAGNAETTPGAAGITACATADYQSGDGLREAVAGVDVVFHLAGVTKALRAADYFAGNARAAENLALVAGDVGRFVHVSSLAAAGPAEVGELSEECEPRPVSEYGRSKLEGERAVRRILPRAVVVRPPVVYGPGDRDVFEMIRGLARGIDLRIGRGERWFSAIYAGDLVEALLAAARSEGAAGRIYFATHAEPVSWTNFAATVLKILNRRARTIVISPRTAAAAGAVCGWWARVRGKPSILSPDKVREAVHRRWTCAAERARRELGFTARTSLEEGLARTIAWYREQGWL